MILLVIGLFAMPAVAFGAISRFTDVPDSHIFADSINWMDENGITAGCSPTEYCPEDGVTRGQMARFMENLAGNLTAEISGLEAEVDALQTVVEGSLGSLLWAESINGDFDSAPTPQLELSAGVNRIVGSMTNTGPEDGIDVFSIVVPADLQLTGVIVASLDDVDSGGNIFISTGGEVIWSANWATSNIRVGDDLLTDHSDMFSVGAGEPLDSGTYVLDLRTLGAPALDLYELEFVARSK